MIINDVRRKSMMGLLPINLAHGHLEERAGAQDKTSNNGCMTSLIGSIIPQQIISNTRDYSTDRNMCHKIPMVVEGKLEPIYGWCITTQIE